jgi:hypothetical protein
MVALGVPEDIVANITAVNLKHSFNFTAYPEGSPTHPSWPAMHSAASNVSFWLPLSTNMTKHQICEAKALDFGVSYGRTLAGGKSYLKECFLYTKQSMIPIARTHFSSLVLTFHFAKDNTVNSNLGQELLARKFPLYLRQKFGAKINDVKRKINTLRHDWDDCFNGECFTDTASTVFTLKRIR